MGVTIAGRGYRTRDDDALAARDCRLFSIPIRTLAWRDPEPE